MFIIPAPILINLRDFSLRNVEDYSKGKVAGYRYSVITEKRAVFSLFHCKGFCYSYSSTLVRLKHLPLLVKSYLIFLYSRFIIWLR